MKLGTSNCVNYLKKKPKHSAQYVYHTGRSASSIARAGTSCETERRRSRNLSSTPGISSRFQITTLKKMRSHGHRYGKMTRGSRVLHREFAQEEMQEEVLLGYPRPVHPRREVPQEYVRHRSLWANEDHTQHIIGCSVPTQLVPIRCQVRHRADFKKKIQLISKDGKVIPHLGGTGKNPCGILLMSITTKTDPALIDQGNLLKSDRVTGMILILNLVKYRSKFGNSSQQFTVTDGRCKQKTSKYSKIFRKMATMKTINGYGKQL